MPSFLRRLAVASIAIVALAVTQLPARALDILNYSPEVLAEAQASGEPYLLDFYATWCTTCQAQERVLDELYSSNPAYAAITIVRVDWDQHARGALVQKLAVPRRSTLVLMKGEEMLGRLVAETRTDAIADLLDLGL